MNCLSKAIDTQSWKYENKIFLGHFNSCMFFNESAMKNLVK